MNKIAKSLKKWWEEWAKLDFIILGFGILLVSGYVFYRQENPGLESPLMDVWSNIATDFVIIWLSVRLVDTFLQSREKHHAIRREIVYNLNFFRVQIRELVPKFYPRNLSNLKQELMWGEERLPKRVNHLTPSENEKIIYIFSKLNQLIQTGDELLQSEISISLSRINSEITDDSIQDKREEINDALRSIDTSKDNIKNDILNFRSLISSNEDFFNESDLERLYDYCNLKLSLSDDENYRYHPVPYINGTGLYKIASLKNIEHEWRLLADHPEYDYEKLFELIESSKQSILNDKKLPKKLVSVIMDFFSEVYKFAKCHQKLRAMVDEITILIDDTRFDIMEESELD
ncbi:MAG: hypothetical protein QY328_03370 [Anaerolineales bacterium]|nr:MAG: hypothetical protein QY328_03370 [Anaerolineales bacterium]